MRGILKKTAVLILVFALLAIGYAQAAAPDAQPTAAQAETVTAKGPVADIPASTTEPTTETPEETQEPGNTISGVVIATEPNSLIIRMENGNTITFALTNITNASVQKGDSVTIEYEGEITSCPEVLGITVTQPNPTNTITGTVMSKIDNDIFVQITSSDVLRFTVTKDTVIIGQTNVVRDDTVEVTFEGDLYENPEALEITIIKANPDRSDTDPNLLNKTLTGIVTKLSKTKVTITTSKNRRYSFRITGDTKIEKNKYKLEMDARIRVTYDGYASDTPDAKVIKVLAPPDPTPTIKPVKMHKIAGEILEKAGNSLVVKTDDGVKYSFLLGRVTIKGDLEAKKGDRATVKFYYDSDTGRPVATEITYKLLHLLGG